MSELFRRTAGGPSTLAPSRSDPAAPVQASAPAPDPEPVDWRDLLVQHRVATHQLLEHSERLIAHLHRLEHPAQMETVVLTPTQPTFESRERSELPVLSIGLFNPSSVTVFFSSTGSASATARAPSCPPNSLLVLPITANQIEVGCDPTALGGANAVVFLFRYFTVQPAFLKDV